MGFNLTSFIGLQTLTEGRLNLKITCQIRQNNGLDSF